MTAPPSPAGDPLYEKLMRERYGDLDKLQRELIGHVPAPGEFFREQPRTPDGAGRYAEEHARARRRLRATYPKAPIELATIGEGGVAHVLVSRSEKTGESLCGKQGRAATAPDTVPVCRVCTT